MFIYLKGYKNNFVFSSNDNVCISPAYMFGQVNTVTRLNEMLSDIWHGFMNVKKEAVCGDTKLMSGLDCWHFLLTNFKEKKKTLV